MMIEIPRILRQEDFRFILVKRGQKDPIEVAWSTKNNYRYDDPKLQAHLARNGNYGVVGGFGNLVMQDFDDLDVYSKFYDTKKLEAAFPAVRTGGGKRHIYGITPEPQRSFRIIGRKQPDAKPQVLVEVRGIGNFCCGPTCLHPSGNRYELINDVPDIPVVPDLEETVRRVAEEKFGVARSPSSNDSFAPVDFSGEYMRLPCIQTLFKIKLEDGRKTHGAKLLGIAWVLDHGGKADGFTPVAQRFAAFQSRPEKPLEWRYIFGRATSAARNRLGWSCAEMITLYRLNQIFPTCSGCTMREAK